jgi:hypothetical protein
MATIFWQILDSVRDRISTLPGVPNVVIRKRPVFTQEDAVPLIIVSPGEEVVGMEAFPVTVEYLYRVQVSLIQAGNRIYEGDVSSLLDLRQSIRNILYQPFLNGAINVYDCRMDMSPAFEVVSGEASNYDVTGMVFTFNSIESRIN